MYSMTQSKVKVTEFGKLWQNLFQSLFPLPICVHCNQKINGEFWYSETTFFRTDFWNSSSFGVTWPSETGWSTFGKRILYMSSDLYVKLAVWCSAVWPWPGTKVKVTEVRKLRKYPISKSCLLHRYACNQKNYDTPRQYIQCESKKNPPYGFLKFFSQTVGNF